MSCSIGSNATRAHGRCQQAFLDAATQHNLTFLVQVKARSLPLPLHPPSPCCVLFPEVWGFLWGILGKQGRICRLCCP